MFLSIPLKSQKMENPQKIISKLRNQRGVWIKSIDPESRDSLSEGMQRTYLYTNTGRETYVLERKLSFVEIAVDSYICDEGGFGYETRTRYTVVPDQDSITYRLIVESLSVGGTYTESLRYEYAPLPRTEQETELSKLFDHIEKNRPIRKIF